MTRALRAKEQGQRRDIVDLADPADPAFRQGCRAQFVNRLAGCGSALRQQFLLPLSGRVAGVDHVDVTPSRMPSVTAPGEIRDRCVDGPTDQKVCIRRARRTTDDIQHVSLRRLEQRPEQPREPHSGKIFQRKSIEEGCIG